VLDIGQPRAARRSVASRPWTSKKLASGHGLFAPAIVWLIVIGPGLRARLLGFGVRARWHHRHARRDGLTRGATGDRLVLEIPATRTSRPTDIVLASDEDAYFNAALSE
jgi:hypothetical protein